MTHRVKRKYADGTSPSPSVLCFKSAGFSPCFFLLILILPHRHLRVYLLQEVENDGNDDEKGRAADGESGAAGEGLHGERQDGHDAEEEGADESDAGDDIGEIVAGMVTGTDAGDEGASLLEILGDHGGIKGDRGIEISEGHDQEEVEAAVDPRVVEEKGERRGIRGDGGVRGVSQEISDDLGEEQNGQGEDDGDDAGLVQAQRQIGGSAAVDFVAADLFGIGDRHRTLGFGYVDHAGDHDESDDQNGEIDGDLGRIEGRGELDGVLGQAGDDTGEDDEADAVADAKFRYELADPHEEHGPGGDDDD